MRVHHAVLISMVVVLVGCGSRHSETNSAASDQGEPTAEAEITIPQGPDAVFSPYGSVSHGDKAYSPDGKHYVVEVEPYDEGNLAVFTVKDSLVQQWDLLPNTNDVKGFCWSPDSRRIAVMYHGGMTPAIQVVEPGKQEIVATADIDRWFHAMEYDKDGTTLLLSESPGGSTTRIVPVKQQ